MVLAMYPVPHCLVPITRSYTASSISPSTPPIHLTSKLPLRLSSVPSTLCRYSVGTRHSVLRTRYSVLTRAFSSCASACRSVSRRRFSLSSSSDRSDEGWELFESAEPCRTPAQQRQTNRRQSAHTNSRTWVVNKLMGVVGGSHK